MSSQTTIELLRRLGLEARKNMPLALILMSILTIEVIRDVDLGLTDFNWIKYSVPAIVILTSSTTALFAYLQAARQEAMPHAVVGNITKGTVPIEQQQDQLLNLQNPLTDDQMRRLHLIQIRRMTDGMVYRLKDELFSLSRRSSVNLSFGAVVCVLGFAILGYFVINMDDIKLDYIQFGMRLSLVVFIEIFAYFFLNLYRTLLFDIKYFQNEITNATFRVMAIEVALATSDSATLKKLCDDLSKTERNSLLKKNETTRELRQVELLAEHDRSIFTAMQKMLESLQREPRTNATKATQGK